MTGCGGAREEGGGGAAHGAHREGHLRGGEGPEGGGAEWGRETVTGRWWEPPPGWPGPYGWWLVSHQSSMERGRKCQLGRVDS